MKHPRPLPGGGPPPREVSPTGRSRGPAVPGPGVRPSAGGRHRGGRSPPACRCTTSQATSYSGRLRAKAQADQGLVQGDAEPGGQGAGRLVDDGPHGAGAPGGGEQVHGAVGQHGQPARPGSGERAGGRAVAGQDTQPDGSQVQGQDEDDTRSPSGDGPRR
ncbi:hypothetical protein GCM10010277_69440 [Streptomyces longisporoflavus]|nr:hypothetical protein GCM10010277_69440 [Streptomyces longisporoflavus]